MPDSFDQAFQELGIDPNWATAGGYTGGADLSGGVAQPWQGQSAPSIGTQPVPGGRAGDPSQAQPWGGQAAAPKAGQFAATNQGFLDWATANNVGENQNSFIKINPAEFPNLLKRYTAETGNQANYQGGPSGDRVDFGQGLQDALTSSGQIWNNESTGAGGPGGVIRPPSGGQLPGGAPSGYGGGPGGGGSPGSMTMPTAPTVKDLTAPDPFTYAPSNLGQFQAPSQVPGMERLGYNPMQAPQNLTAQQIGQPSQLSYNAMGAPAALNYTNLATPAGYQAEQYQGLSADQLASDPSYQFRFDQGQKATENALAHSGALRTGNAAQALTNYGQGAASQEYAAADARARGTVAQNNQSSLGAYQTNAQTGLAYNQNANQNALQFGQQNFSNAFNVNQANNQGQMAATQGNITNNFNATNANNATNLAYGTQNFNQGFQTNQANNAGQFQATQANNQNALQQQGQQFGQAATGYGLNQAAQQQGYNQALGAYGQNASTQLAYGSQNQNNQLANYQAQTNAALGLGNLNLGYQNSAQNYALGQGGLNLQQQNQQWGQGLDTYDRNYRANVTDPWQQQYQLASLGNPGAPNTQGNANAQSSLYGDIGNAQAAGTVGAANAYGNMASNLGQTGQAAYLAWLRSQPQMQGGGGGQLPGQ